MISSRELDLLRSIGAHGASSQRSLSQQVGLSLGITNMLLRRLIRKGCIKVKALDRRSVRYILTPKGFSQKLKKSYDFTLKTLRAHQALRDRLEDLVRRQVSRGCRSFRVAGEGDLARLLGLVLDGFKAEGVAWATGAGPGEDGELLLLASPDSTQSSASRQAVNVVAELVDSPDWEALR